MNQARNYVESVASGRSPSHYADRRTDARSGLVGKSGDPNLRILVIDDVEAVLMMLEEGLTLLGQEVLKAMSGEEGIELFKKNPADLIICDLGLQDQSGLQVGRAIKDFCLEKSIAKPPFIILSGREAGLEHKDGYTKFGVDRFVRKPVNILELLSIIRQTVARDDRKIAES
jgi:CheY-like chemotaxis protein